MGEEQHDAFYQLATTCLHPCLGCGLDSKLAVAESGSHTSQGCSALAEQLGKVTQLSLSCLLSFGQGGFIIAEISLSSPLHHIASVSSSRRAYLLLGTVAASRQAEMLPLKQQWQGFSMAVHLRSLYHRITENV